MALVRDPFRNPAPEGCVSLGAAQYPAAPAGAGPSKIFAATGVAASAQGSAYVEAGGTRLLVTCGGPREASVFSVRGRLACTCKFAPFASVRRRGHVEDEAERAMGLAVGQALAQAVLLERYPKALIELHVTVLEEGGGVEALAVTAGSLALADAGVAVRDLVSGAAVACVDGELRRDPRGGEAAVLTLSAMVAFDEVAGLTQSGAIPAALQDEAVRMALAACAEVRAVQRACLLTV